MSEPVLFETRGKVGLIRLNRPEVFNALNDALMEALGAALDVCETDENIGCVVITGSDKAFAAGADIAAMRDMDFMDAYKSNFITRNWERLKTFRKPVIAAVSGVALGGGCELALMCDIVYAAETARFALPEVKIGVIPGAGGTQRLTRAVGKFKALKMLLTGQPVGAAEAFAMGLVSEVVADGEVLERALCLAREIAALPPLAVAQIKEVVLAGQDLPLDAALTLERKAFQLLFASADQKEGMRAFIEKRPPEFKGI